jgi:hypothetical protein
MKAKPTQIGAEAHKASYIFYSKAYPTNVASLASKLERGEIWESESFGDLVRRVRDRAWDRFLAGGASNTAPPNDR